MMMVSRFDTAHTSAFAPCANASSSCAQSAFHTVILMMDAILASIFAICLISILGLGILLVLAILVLAGLLILHCLPWWIEPISLPV